MQTLPTLNEFMNLYLEPGSPLPAKIQKLLEPYGPQLEQARRRYDEPQLFMRAVPPHGLDERWVFNTLDELNSHVATHRRTHEGWDYNTPQVLPHPHPDARAAYDVLAANPKILLDATPQIPVTQITLNGHVFTATPTIGVWEQAEIALCHSRSTLAHTTQIPYTLHFRNGDIHEGQIPLNPTQTAIAEPLSRHYLLSQLATAGRLAPLSRQATDYNLIAQNVSETARSHAQQRLQYFDTGAYNLDNEHILGTLTGGPQASLPELVARAFDATVYNPDTNQSNHSGPIQVLIPNAETRRVHAYQQVGDALIEHILPAGTPALTRGATILMVYEKNTLHLDGKPPASAKFEDTMER